MVVVNWSEWRWQKSGSSNRVAYFERMCVCELLLHEEKKPVYIQKTFILHVYSIIWYAFCIYRFGLSVLGESGVQRSIRYSCNDIFICSNSRMCTHGLSLSVCVCVCVSASIRIYFLLFFSRFVALFWFIFCWSNLIFTCL